MVLYPKDQEGKHWIQEHVCFGDWQILGSRIQIDSRHIEPIYEAMEEEGLNFYVTDNAGRS